MVLVISHPLLGQVLVTLVTVMALEAVELDTLIKTVIQVVRVQ